MSILKRVSMIILVIVINLNNLGCAGNISILEKKNILSNDEVKLLTSMMLRYQNKDGGFYQYFDDETSLYSTYRNLDILSKNDMLSDEAAEHSIEWMKNINTTYFVNDRIYTVLNNIYYYISIAKLMNYDIPSETNELIQNSLMKLYDGHNFKLSTTLKTDDTKPYEEVKILANSEGIHIFRLLDYKLDNKDELIDWYYRLLDESAVNDSISLSGISAAIQALADMDTKPVGKNEKIYEILVNYEILDNAEFMEIYNVFVINKYLIEEGCMESWLLDYDKFLKAFQDKGVFVTEQKGFGNALFTDLAIDMTLYLNINFDWSKELNEISKNQLSNGSYNDSLIIYSDLMDTFYALKLLDILGMDSEILKNAKEYIKTNEENYNAFSDYEKIIYLRMKYDLDIFNKNDEENVKSLLDVAYNHSIEKNYFFIIPLLEICNDFGVPIDENYLVKISDFINNTDINNADITEDKFVLLIYKYQLAKASNITDDNNLRRKIIDGYNNNFLKYENQEELLGLILLADIQISSDNNISQLFNEDFKRIKFIIEHQRFEEEGGREISFYELYVSLFILKY